MSAETPEIRLRRLRMRSWRRGMREMDLLLGPFADAALDDFPADALDRFEAFLAENDQDLYLWICRGRDSPARHADVISRICAFHRLVAP